MSVFKKTQGVPFEKHNFLSFLNSAKRLLISTNKTIDRNLLIPVAVA